MFSVTRVSDWFTLIKPWPIIGLKQTRARRHRLHVWWLGYCVRDKYSQPENCCFSPVWTFRMFSDILANNYSFRPYSNLSLYRDGNFISQFPCRVSLKTSYCMQHLYKNKVPQERNQICIIANISFSMQSVSLLCFGLSWLSSNGNSMMKTYYAVVGFFLILLSIMIF